ncbi:MAG: hypothetical protein Q4B13_07185 [Lautropia sp.]|nr:hypothetical protein [Lautropia sp.]
MSDTERIYKGWTDMWNGQLALADQILAPGFKAHLTANATPAPSPVIDPRTAKDWIATIRAKYETLTYDVVMGPFRAIGCAPTGASGQRWAAARFSRLASIF